MRELLKILAIVVPLMFVLTACTEANADVTNDIEKLISEVEEAAPPGWTVEFDIADLYLGDMRPVLRITSRKELPVEQLAPSAPPDVEIEHKKVVVWLAFMAHLTPDVYQAARDRSETLNNRRREFVAEQLMDVPRASKGEDPPPPFAYRPRTKAEVTAVRRYAFLWLDTEPVKLPTHYYKELAMWYWPATIKIHDKEGEQEHLQIIEALNKILSPYEGKIASGDGGR